MNHAAKDNAFITELNAMQYGTPTGHTSSSIVTGSVTSVIKQIGNILRVQWQRTLVTHLNVQGLLYEVKKKQNDIGALTLRALDTTKCPQSGENSA